MTALTVETLVVTPFQQNCRLLINESSQECIVVDPGGEAPRILQRVAQLGVRVVEIWLTHSHIDHCGAVAVLKAAVQAPLVGMEVESFFRQRLPTIATMYGLDASEYPACPEPETFLTGGMTLERLGKHWELFHTPGHSPGSLTFYCKEDGFALSGDVLFRGSIGRSDLPGGDHEQLLDSIRHLAERLPPTTRVLSGHGPDTTLGQELRSNPFLGGLI